MQKKYFGTDGIRSRVGEGMIRPDQVLKLGWATGKVMKSMGQNKVMIGKDTRISGYMFESALEAGFIAAGVDVLLLGPMPTPAIAYLTQTFSADAGIVISASHNPHYDNGIKFFSADGRKISDEMELKIEAAFEEELEVVASEKLGKARRIDDAPGRYIEFCKSTFNSVRKLNGLKIAVDCAQGATYHIAPNVFRELGAEVIEVATKPDGLNINKGCGATDLALLKKTVIEQYADLGVALDGDGDRVIMVDENGREVDGDAILYLLAMATGGQVTSVVGTVMSNLGLENTLKSQGVELHRAAVGDRYVMEKLVEHDLIYGAEPSGHVLCLDKTTTGDGIVAALQVLSVVVSSEKTIGQLVSDLHIYPQVLINIHVKSAAGLDDNAALEQAKQNAQRQLGEKGRILIRASGTEPLIRVMVEAADQQLVDTVAEMLAGVVKSEFS